MSSSTMTQEEIIGQIYRNFAHLAGEIAIDRCRNRVLLNLVREKLNISDDELNGLFQTELEANLEQYVTAITRPMLSGLEEPKPQGGGCCMMAQGPTQE